MPVVNQPKMTSASELQEFPADGYRYELVLGALHMMSPAGGRHGRIAGQVAYLLKTHVDRNRLGVVFAAETGFLIQQNPDTVLAPDVAFLSQAKFETIENESQYLPLAQDFVAEVLSPSDRFARVESNAFAWLDAGTRLVLIVDPETETIHAYWSRDRIEIYDRTEVMDCSAAVEGWTLPIADIFRLYS